MKKKLLIIGGILFVVIMTIGLNAGNSPEVKKSFEAGRQQAAKDLGRISQPNQTVYALEAKAELVEKNKIMVTGKTNLPDGALLDVYVYRLIFMQGDSKPRTSGQSRGVEKASVYNGQFTADVSPRDDLFAEEIDKAGYQIVKISPDVRIEVVFDPLRTEPEQKPEVLQAVGNLGENLKSSSQVKVIGEKTDNPYNQLQSDINFPYPYAK